jgi:fibronectin type 3 domain-containing protein
LTADGIKVASGDGGAQIEMRLSGLSAGSHTLLIYHNVWDNYTTNTVAPLKLSVNGTLVVSNLAMSVRVTNNMQAALSYLNLNAVAGQDMVVLIQSQNTATYNNVYINGFEIDTPNAKLQANTPSPANADEHVNADAGSLTLSWGAATSGAASHDVYFGTSSTAVANATRASAEFKGNQTSTSYPVSGLNSPLTYYWRVDEISASGTTTKGSLWYFRPRHLAFPGAEGYGRFARGGRGGRVIEVSNLNDSGAGSLRDALTGNYGPRTVVFAVSGLITLSDDLTIDGNNPYITVAGQTAPGKGICVRNHCFGMSGARDVIFRHLRIRVGKDSGETQNASGLAGVDHVIMDHCSVSWGIDEEISSRGARNMTLQRTLISEALNVAGHANYPAGTAHGYAASIGGDIGSFHHNLLAHCEGRNWSLAGGLDASGYFAGRLDIFNNVVYNWGGRTTDGGAHEVNFVNNYYKPGASSSYFYALNAQYDDFPGTQQYYFAGNVMPGHFQWSNQTAGRTASDGTGSVPTSYSPWVSAAFFPSYATIQTVTNAYKNVLSDVGCNQPVMDDHDVRVIRETIDGTYTYSGSVSGDPGLPDTTADVGGWEDYGTATRPAGFDTDHDGMPDWWEQIKGFNTNSASGDFSESNADPNGDGYTNLEDYLNWMAALHFDCTNGASLDVNLTRFTRGFTNRSPVYTVSTATNGTVTLATSTTARFTASAGGNALGSFTFVVTDADGHSMTNPVGVRIISGTVSPPAAPTALAATASNAVVNLRWTQSVSPGITTNKVYRSTNGSSGPYNLLAALSARTNYSDTAVVNGSTYYYSVTAVNSNGESSLSAYIGATPSAPQIPAAPTNLAAVAGNAQVRLSWSASSGATSYRVKRSTTNGGPYSNIATNTSLTYTNTGLVNGTTYYYVVSAVNTNGESANSSQVSATPAAVSAPAAPTNLTATAGNAQVRLSWSASGGASSYRIKRSTTNGGPYSNIATNTTSLAYTNTGLVNGTTYYYVVSAVNTNGESANSSQVSATPATGSAPAAPTNLVATAGNAQVRLSWSASSGASSYRIKRSTTNGGPYSNIATNTTSLAYTNTGLVNGTTYYYVVSAVNTNGESANSAQVSAAPSAGTVTTIQAEAASYGGGVTIDSNNAGFNGTGFANFPTTGGYLQFTNINGGTGGTSTLSIRYALGATSSRTGQLRVNGVTNSITFAITGAWTTWTNKPVSITLGAGTTNVIRFQSTGADMGNIDEITVTAP